MKYQIETPVTINLPIIPKRFQFQVWSENKDLYENGELIPRHKPFEMPTRGDKDIPW